MSPASHTYFSPAKLNLFLAITGRRPDGFHDLVSVVTPLRFGDELTVTIRSAEAPGGRFTLTCTDPEVPCDGTNLVLRAAEAFAAATGWQGGATFGLAKSIPMGAGLGGGSSNGATALRALHALTGASLDAAALARLAATLGSDCPLFLAGVPAVMRGRGEHIAPLPVAAARRLSGKRVLVFKPAFSVPTAWAYRQMADEAAAGNGDVYLAPAAAEARVTDWIDHSSADPESLLFNNMERPAFRKFVALPAMLELLRRDFGLAPRMTGSGSACFTFLPADAPIRDITGAIKDGWGVSSVVVDTQLA